MGLVFVLRLFFFDCAVRAQVPHRGGDRLHVSVKKFNRGVNAALGRLQKTTGAGWHTIQSSINTTIVSGVVSRCPLVPFRST